MLRPAVWTLDWEALGGMTRTKTTATGRGRVLVLTAADGRTEARFVLADRLVLAHLAADVRGLLAEGQSLPPIPEAEPPTSLPTLGWTPRRASPARGSPFVGYPPLGSRSRGTTRRWPSWCWMPTSWRSCSGAPASCSAPPSSTCRWVAPSGLARCRISTDLIRPALFNVLAILSPDANGDVHADGFVGQKPLAAHAQVWLLVSRVSSTPVQSPKPQQGDADVYEGRAVFDLP